MNSNNNSHIHIESNACCYSGHTVGELVQAHDHTVLEDLIIAIADDLVDKKELDFESACIAFADYVAVGKAIVARILKLPANWDGTSWMALTTAVDAVDTQESLGNIDALPLGEVAHARLKIAVDCDEATMLRMALAALIQTV